MKKTITFSMLLMLFMDAKAQHFELKVSPLAVVVGKYNINAEYLINDDFGIDLSPSYASIEVTFNSFGLSRKRETIGTQLAGKYYILPKTIGDGLSFGPYVSYYSTKFMTQSTDSTTGLISTETEKADDQWVVGSLASYKFLFANNMLLDIGAGAGYIVTGARNESSRIFANPFAKMDITLRLAVGYRFGGKKADKEK